MYALQGGTLHKVYKKNEKSLQKNISSTYVNIFLKRIVDKIFVKTEQLNMTLHEKL